MNRRDLIKKMTAGVMLLSLNENSYGDIKLGNKLNFPIEGFNNGFRTVIDPSIEVNNVTPFDGNLTPNLTLSTKNDFSIQISCQKLSYYADPLSLGSAIVSLKFFKDVNINSEKTNLSRAVFSYKKDNMSDIISNLYIFKESNNFIFVEFTYNYEEKFKLWEDQFVNNFEFLKNDNDHPLKTIDIKDKNIILLPYDWQVKDITNQAKKIFDSKNSMTSAYYFENLSKINQIPNMTLMHYKGKLTELEYLMEFYKDTIINKCKNCNSLHYDLSEILTHRDNKTNNVLMFSLEIKLHDTSAGSLPMLIQANLFEAANGEGCYMIYANSSTVTDGRMANFMNNPYLMDWMVIDIMGSSMARLLLYSLKDGMYDYSNTFNYKLQ